MERICPPLGTGSVDVSALHKAACDPKADLAEALEKATTRVEAAPPSPAPSNPVPVRPASDAE